MLGDADRKVLERILLLGHRIERAAIHPLPEIELSQIVTLLSQLQEQEDLALQKIASIQDHLHPNMDLKTFLGFLVPIERILNRSVNDDQFLLEQSDRPQKLPDKQQDLIVVLDNLRSSFNVGSIFRSVECFAGHKVYLCGYTTTPDDVSLQKTSMQTHEWVKHEAVRSTEEILKKLKSDGYSLVALEKSRNSIPLSKTQFQVKTVFLVGNERFGLDPHLLKLCDVVSEIPMLGKKNSLNVAAALTCALYEYTRQHLS
jgi:23S rRNA (guanosine2251-2'-O)-methyltransferase